VQVAILPAERGLDHLMQHIQGEIGSQLQSPLDRRDDAYNLDPQPEGARWLDPVFEHQRLPGTREDAVPVDHPPRVSRSWTSASWVLRELLPGRMR
jgi:hypothetical protein